MEREGFLFIEEVLRGVEGSLGDLGWSVLISFLRAADPADVYQRMQKISAKVDGMVIAEGIVGPEQLAVLAARVPIALIAANSGVPHADVIGADNAGDRGRMFRGPVRCHQRLVGSARDPDRAATGAAGRDHLRQ